MFYILLPASHTHIHTHIAREISGGALLRKRDYLAVVLRMQLREQTLIPDFQGVPGSRFIP